jgi:hypothetical protein
MFSDEIVSCYKDTAELVLFHDVEMKGHIREGSIQLEVGQGIPGSKFIAGKERSPAICQKSRNTLK